MFFRPHLHYSDVVHKQDFDRYFHEILESIQYNPLFIITEAIGDMFKGKLYQDCSFSVLSFLTLVQESQLIL